MRESMARKASSALAEVRETREDLKIKELSILDLTKKYQETEFKLNTFKALYEEVINIYIYIYIFKKLNRWSLLEINMLI